ncbi:hypothetical protein SSS_10342 [Sarcoptes scabiei]|nr:hypothetical protein SSS_10342 [Sarcoptes scabiei]
MVNRGMNGQQGSFGGMGGQQGGMNGQQGGFGGMGSQQGGQEVTIVQTGNTFDGQDLMVGQQGLGGQQGMMGQQGYGGQQGMMGQQGFGGVAVLDKATIWVGKYLPCRLQFGSNEKSRFTTIGDCSTKLQCCL